MPLGADGLLDHAGTEPGTAQSPESSRAEAQQVPGVGEAQEPKPQLRTEHWTPPEVISAQTSGSCNAPGKEI